MAGVLDAVDQRTRLAGRNRLELLLFKLRGRQRFGINVFKVQEVVQCPPLTQVPHASHIVRGVANMRGRTIPIIDLSMAIGRRALDDLSERYVVVTEFNRKVQGFLVDSVERIINLNWEDILPPPSCAGKDSYLTGVTRVDDELVEIIDVEKVIAEVLGMNEMVSAAVTGQDSGAEEVKHILVADDSSVARNQIRRTIEQIGYTATVVNDGRKALEQLKAWAEEGPIEHKISLVISDIEMPEMDGYTLTTEIRQDPRLRDLYVILHTSLSGVFNETLVESVGADKFISKFVADELANAVLNKNSKRPAA